MGWLFIFNTWRAKMLQKVALDIEYLRNKSFWVDI